MSSMRTEQRVVAMRETRPQQQRYPALYPDCIAHLITAELYTPEPFWCYDAEGVEVRQLNQANDE